MEAGQEGPGQAMNGNMYGYLKILYLQIHLLKFICNPKISTHGACMVIQGHVEIREKWESPSAHVPS